MKTSETIDWTLSDEWPGLIEQISQGIINSRHALGMTHQPDRKRQREPVGEDLDAAREGIEPGYPSHL